MASTIVTTTPSTLLPDGASVSAATRQQLQTMQQQAVAAKSQRPATIMQPPPQVPLASQPCSQPSVSMTQPSSQPNPPMSTGLHRLYSDSATAGPENAMGIYSATYSGVNVYETEVNEVAVMRRRNDGWLNATQILKVAGVDKGRRTKILEKEIQLGQHEKVQGGYGKYQGTWIPFERGLELCRLYHVDKLLQRLLTHNMGQGGGAMAEIETPTKEQAMAAQRKRMYSAAASAESRINSLSNSGTFFKNISAGAHHAIQAISKARFDSPTPRNRSGPVKAPASFKRQSSMQSMGDFPANSQQSFVSDGTGARMADSAFSTQEAGVNGDKRTEPHRKRSRISLTPVDSFGYSQSVDMYAGSFPESPTEPNESFIYSQACINHDGQMQEGSAPMKPLPFEVSAEADKKRSMLMGLFMEGGNVDQSHFNLLKRLPPHELDMPIDQQSHTALHWAATLARMPLVKALVVAGASPMRVNALGETALMRACAVTNSMDLNSFPDLLDVLGGTIDIRDDKGRTVLHQIALTSAVNGRNLASRYYLESLLEWVVRQGSAPNSQVSGVNGAGHGPGKMGIARFMGEIVNVQDLSGDTALNIAARVRNRSIISQLLEVGADPNIANKTGLRPIDFGIGVEPGDGAPTNGEVVGRDRNGSLCSSEKSKESSDELVNSITQILNESSAIFQSERKAKQQAVDSLHNALRATSTQLGEAWRRIEALQVKSNAQHLDRQRLLNLRHAVDEETHRLGQCRASRPPSQNNTGSVVAWEQDLQAALQAASANGDANGATPALGLPTVSVLRARICAVQTQCLKTRNAVSGMRAQSREVELKYRQVVALCTRMPEKEVDTHLEGLTRAVESEQNDLELARIRRFLGGVEATVPVH